MNAIAQPSPEEARAERQLRQCKRLAELGCELAEAAAALSKTDLAQQLEAQNDPDPDTLENPPSPTRRADPGFLFVRLSRAVRQAIALENRIIEDAEASRAAKPPRRPDERRDERRDTLQRTLGHATKGRADLQYGLHVRIDEKLDTDPDAQIPVETLLAQLIAQLGLPEDTPTTAPQPKRYVYNPPEPEPDTTKPDTPKPPRPAFILETPRDPWPWERPPEPPA